jgi:preprotein translocase subunit YajC
VESGVMDRFKLRDKKQWYVRPAIASYILKRSDKKNLKGIHMNASELRTGNKVIANGLLGGMEVTVEQIGSKGTLSDDKRVIIFKETDVGEFVCDCNGIPLFQEWLVKYGFKRVNNAWEDKAIRETDFNIWNPVGTDVFSLNGETYCPKLKYVHQLQNLYFALTGEELHTKD